MKLIFSVLFLLFFTNDLHSFEDPTVDVEALHQFWTNNQPTWSKFGHYYKFELNGKIFPGRREWKTRWDMLSKDVIWDGKKVLELGANMGLCSIFLSKYVPIKEIVAMDNIKSSVEQIQGLQKIFHTQFPAYHLDLDKDEYESTLGYNYDIVICMSLYHWVHNKARLLQYLSHFSEILYEGHDKASVEIARFKQIGFSHYKILGTTDFNKRALILFSK